MKPLLKISVIAIFLSGTAIYLPSCRKEATLPVVTTNAVTNITQNSASVELTLTDDGGAGVTSMGFCWSTSPNPTISSNRMNIRTGTGSSTRILNGLAPNTKYYLRAFAVNSAGTSYGNELTFTTSDIAKAISFPLLTTNPVISITSTSAVSGGTITDDGGGFVNTRGICWSTSDNPTIENSIAFYVTYEYSFSLDLSQLKPYTTYYVRAFAANVAGLAYGNQVSFMTEWHPAASAVPTIITTGVSSITSNTAVSGGTITNDGGGYIIAKGISWSTDPDWYIYEDDNTIYGNETGSGPFVSYLSNLNPGTIYYVKAYAVNSAGIGFGSTLSFTTAAASSGPGLPFGTVSDIEGNIYKTIRIGNQTWMAENLKTTKYNDGELIPNITGDVEWLEFTSGAYCWYNNDGTGNKNTYGALYNWYSVNTGKLCPAGWHVPSNKEWGLLTTYLGGAEVAGYKLKEAGTNHWQSPNAGADNASGFTALPGGYRDVSSDFGGFFDWIGNFGLWWSSSPDLLTIEQSSSFDLNFLKTDHGLLLDSSSVGASTIPGWVYNNSGLSVRCLMN